jgi:uncharacterized protein with FMN-binding domain
MNSINKHSLYLAVAAILLAASLQGASRHERPEGTREAFCSETVATNPAAADTLKVNTTNLGSDVEGFNGTTPVEISVVKGKVTRIRLLPNQETPSFLQLVIDSGLLKALDGKTVEEASKVKLDAVSGATYSSTAIIENIHRGLDSLKK